MLGEVDLEAAEGADSDQLPPEVHAMLSRQEAEEQQAQSLLALELDRSQVRLIVLEDARRGFVSTYEQSSGSHYKSGMSKRPIFLQQTRQRPILSPPRMRCRSPPSNASRLCLFLFRCFFLSAVHIATCGLRCRRS